MDLIIGGGITGISYALFSKDRETLILEKENELGGYCRTTKRNGYVWDYSGHFFHFQDEEIKNLVFRNIEKSLLKKVDKSTKIYYCDRLIDYPFQKNIHQLPKSEFIDCLYDLYNISNGEYHTFKQMLYHKFGKSIADKFLVPYNEKLYACDLDTLDVDAMGRFFPYANKEEIIQNFKQSENNSYNGTFLYPYGGAEIYVKALSDGLNTDQYKLNCTVHQIDTTNHIVTLASGETIQYDRLISTIPLPDLLKLCNIDYNHDLFSWNQVLVFNLGFDKKSTNDTDHWIYFPQKDISFYRVGFYDNILETDKLSMYVEIGFTKEAKINPNEWIGRVISDLKKTGIIDETFMLKDYQSIIMNPAYVHVSEKSITETQRVKAILKDFDIYSIGRYGSWIYCSIEDNIQEARQLAKEIAR
ncbi:protoporphyrinogen/coproporphyrinogen oxidase [Paramuribaculum intestinale]|uniref:protoporphyrinogen/coproporphyrinogen oxidase n=2 Tax=Paramuribaculum intestinale TaxID=2094151 RepID=UPI00272A4D1B|nr:FAD-dependent oxidoreductase [Paramuribaculum intestinale]